MSLSLSSFTILAPLLAIIVCLNRMPSYFISKHARCSGGDDRPNWVPCGTCSWLCPNCHSGKMQTFRLDQLFVSNKFWIVFHTITATGEFLQDTKKALKYQSKARRVRKLFKIQFCLGSYLPKRSNLINVLFMFLLQTNKSIWTNQQEEKRFFLKVWPFYWNVVSFVALTSP